ncbi:MAG: Rrf2 family transcriptional regulator [Lachnospiraceae bacterium]|nr:Rrf2 family transcriptional regulator [Lachnospiraceae bacterium]
MMISSRGRYALRIMIDLGQHYEEENLISLKEISVRQNVSMKYLELIASALHKGGLVKSARGKNGGYRLAKGPDQITIGSILKLVENNIAPVNCIEAGTVNCERAAGCITIPMWQKLDQVINDYLDSITLKNLLDGEV